MVLVYIHICLYECVSLMDPLCVSYVCVCAYVCVCVCVSVCVYQIRVLGKLMLSVWNRQWTCHVAWTTQLDVSDKEILRLDKSR